MNLQNSNTRLAILTSLAMIAFAGNSLLCRLALKQTSIDPTSFTSIRIISGAITLGVIVLVSRRSAVGRGNWLSAVMLVVYAAAFSHAYVSLPSATGALILFGAVQATMITHGIRSGERLKKPQLAGLVGAFVGLVVLLLPGLTAPPLLGSLVMFTSGLAWGVYSLLGKGEGDSTRVTAGNFLRAVPIAVVLSLVMHESFSIDSSGLWYAIASGSLTSGVGYALWYMVIPLMKSTNASIVQLSVPVITAIGGVAILNEPLTLRLVIATIAILGGIVLVIREK
ncbi:MAG: DMT family transporter [Akkermansiaceae bacterium]